MTEVRPSWGLLPAHVHALVYRREWSSLQAVKHRLSGRKSFPIRIPLKPPKGSEALKDVLHLQTFVQQWNAFPHQHLIEREVIRYRDVGEQNIPKCLVIESVSELLNYLGPDAVQQSRAWERKISRFLAIDRKLSGVCIEELATIDQMSDVDVELVTRALTQLKPRLGDGLYLRALPLTAVHTKIIETYESLITKCLDNMFQGEVSGAGGLNGWLGCKPKPNGWLLVRPLCPESQSAFGGLPLLKMTQQDLARFELPCDTVIVVENEAPGLSLPPLARTIAVFGGGANVSWLSNPCLQQRRVYYWGDIDSFGFKFLNDARGRCHHLQSVMMDRATYHKFSDSVTMDNLYQGELPNLCEEEAAAFVEISTGRDTPARLEQEYISQDYVNAALARLIS